MDTFVKGGIEPKTTVDEHLIPLSSLRQVQISESTDIEGATNDLFTKVCNQILIYIP